MGAVVLTPDGQIFGGAVLENSNWTAGVCAEVAAITDANSNGHYELVSMAIALDPKDFIDYKGLPPCGGCRQVISDCAQTYGRNIEVIIANADKSKVVVSSIEELLPGAFGPKHLPKAII
ncbi:MAG TPA: cytidine deaminase [Candidatus Nanoarchaeia archaeon]|nr:cytidine deaminase [Candidatus Nanoarchaeia archaeon]